MTQYTTTVQINKDGDYFIEFPSELLEQVGWVIGDTILWEETEISHDDFQGIGYVLRKKEEEK